MIRGTFESAWWVVREPRILAASAAATVLSGLAFWFVGYRGDLSAPSAGTITGVILVLLARSWFSLSIAMTALAVLRRDRSRWLVPVGVLPALGVLLVTLLPLVPVIIGAFLMAIGGFIAALGVLLLVLGVWWVAMWSQAGMLLMDGQSDFIGSAENSSFMTRGYRSEIVLIWFVMAIAYVTAGWLENKMTTLANASTIGPPIAALVSLGLRIGADLFATCCYAAMYFELDKLE